MAVLILVSAEDMEKIKVKCLLLSYTVNWTIHSSHRKQDKICKKKQDGGGAVVLLLVVVVLVPITRQKDDTG